MKLNDAEMKLVAQLQKQKRIWRFLRPVVAIVVPLTLVAWFVMYFAVKALIVEHAALGSDTYIVPYFLPMFYCNVLLCMGMLIVLFRDWRGNAVRDLLLKLIEEHRGE